MKALVDTFNQEICKSLIVIIDGSFAALVTVNILSDVSLYFSARKVPFELQVNFDPSGGFPQSQYNKGFKLNYFQIPC